ncbi:MAG: aminotransferase class I/II-fold pyridoxal phosphate-dependent enzyme [Planctomycetota bacterium]|nr:aminotransferase class I/II-fold pyridoxal phosphate-dependent enzyme [Planctomycetota bacterium]
MSHPWISDRAMSFDASGIRKVFELASKMTDPINLSIGQPDFDVPPAARQAAIDAIGSKKNAYAMTQGIAPLREKLQQQVQAEFQHADRSLFITSGTSGGLLLAMMAMVNPGDEVIVFDPCFVMYEPLIKLVHGTPVVIDTYPDFKIDAEKVRAAITPKTKLILFNSPANPTGYAASEDEVRAIAKVAAENNVALLSDEIYRMFCYDKPHVSPAKYNDQTLVIDGFSKSYAMTGWRVGWAHGPSEIIEQMLKVQQYSFVCAPQPFQWGAVEAMDIDMQVHIDEYRQKRDRIVAGLRDCYELATPGGAFYAFPEVPLGPQYPWKNANEFVLKAIENQLLIIPGKIFSHRDTHIRISYAATNQTIDRGIEVLRRMAKAK